MATSSNGLIVVGADGSNLSIGAPRWAARQASYTGSEIMVVTGFYVPITIFIVPTYTDEDYARDAQMMLDQTVVKAFESRPPNVRVRGTLMEEKPAMALTGIAKDADLLVIGSHGQGELPGMHLGSVASYCVHHAPAQSWSSEVNTQAGCPTDTTSNQAFIRPPRTRGKHTGR